jgi:hypothetical protein
VINENYEFKNNVKTCPRCLAPLVWRKEWFYGCMNFYKTHCRYMKE